MHNLPISKDAFFWALSITSSKRPPGASTRRNSVSATPGRGAKSSTRAQTIAKQIDWKLEEAAVGGGSDGNFTAGMGIPTLDGMGGVGEGAHALHENIVISELPRRALLLAGMIENA